MHRRNFASMKKSKLAILLLLILVGYAAFLTVYRIEPSNMFWIEEIGHFDPAAVKWAHRVNDLHLLAQASQTKAISAIECDVISGGDEDMTAIMGHDDASGGLSLRDYIQAVMDSRFLVTPTHILKFDFKDENAVANSIPAIKVLIDAVGSPERIFLNADILRGDRGCSARVPASAFLAVCTEIPGATLSLGWCVDGEKCQYTEDMIEEMESVVKNLEEPTHVTFAVNAKCMSESLPALLKLLSARPLWGFTFWYSGDNMTEQEKLWLLNTMENDERLRNRSFYDIKDFDAPALIKGITGSS